MSENRMIIFIFLNFLSLIASIAGIAALLIGSDLQFIGGWLLLLGAEIIFWLMLERGISNTRKFGAISSFIMLIIITFIILGDYTILVQRYDVLFLVIYLPFRTLYLGVPADELTFPILFSSVITIFSGILLVFTTDFGLIYYIAVLLFFGGEVLYFWKREDTEFYHRAFGFLSFGCMFLLLLIVFIPLENTPALRLDLFLILIYIPFRIFESSLPKYATTGRTVAFQLSYGLLGLFLIVLAISLEALLALETFGPIIPSYTDKTWVILEFTFDLIQNTPLLYIGGFLYITFHSLDIGVLLVGGLGIFFISEIIFILKLVVIIFSKERELTKNTIYLKLHAIMWYLGILVAIFGAYIAWFILAETQGFTEAFNVINLLIILLVVYFVVKLILNCITTTYWGPITLTLVSQVSFVASIIITYILTETLVVENIQIEPFILGISLGILAIIFLLIATYTISERLKIIVLYLWAGWSTIALVVSIFGLLQQNNELILVAVPLTILAMVITVISSREKFWGVSKGPDEVPGFPPAVEAPAPPATTIPAPPAAAWESAPPETPEAPDPSTMTWGPPPPEPSELLGPLDQEELKKKKKKHSEKLKSILQEELDKY
ncbi:MAG: hypothetical protein ACFFAE_07295 [Candidatus Hodarchaeota archaeon]